MSVLFVDVVGFTAFAEGRDPERVRAVQQQYFDVAAGAISRHGGVIEKFIGDAVMAVWGTPVAHEDDGQRAVRAALEILKAVEGLGHDLEARAGVVTGEAAVALGTSNQGMVAGDMVNTAARLQAAAEPGHVLADGATVEVARSVIAFEATGELNLKGKAGPTRAWRAVRVQASRAGDLVEPPFVGREEELRRLKDLLHAVGEDHRARLVSITGPAGIGKSRLVEELGSYANGLAATTYWHVGRAPSYGDGLAFWALGEMVRRRAGLAEGDDEATTVSAIGATLEQFVPLEDERIWIGPAMMTLLGVGGAGAAEALFPAWRTFFERLAERGTTVLVFEDLQWADSGTVEFIEHVLDWSRNRPILVITLARPELLDGRPGWGIGRSSATAMTLDPLPESAIRNLLAGLLPGVPSERLATIVSRAEGIPLYAVEMVRSLLSAGLIERRGDAYGPTDDLARFPVPASLRSLIASRLDALPSENRTVLQQGSVLGQTFTIDALSSVSDLEPPTLEPLLRTLVRREILQIEVDPGSPERGQYRFVQSLIREVAYDTLTLKDRRTRHLAAARYLEAMDSDEAAGALASHYLAAYRASEEGAEAEAVAVQARISLQAAAERAARLGAHDLAVQNLQHALDLTHGRSETAHLLERIALSAQAAAQPEASAWASRAVETYHAAGDEAGAVRATNILADILMDESRTHEALQVLEAAIASVGRGEAADEAEASLYAMLARGRMRLDDNEAAVAAADRALVIAERHRLGETAATALVNKASALTQLGRTWESTALLEGAVRLAEAGGWLHLALRARGNLGNTLSDDEPLRAMEVHFAATDIARRLGDNASFGSSAWTYSLIAQATGSLELWSSAMALIAEALELPGSDLNRLALRSQVIWLDIQRGLDVTAQMEEIAPIAGEASEPRVRGLYHYLACHRAAAQRRWGDAIVEGRRAIDIDRFATGACGPAIVLAALHLRAIDSLRWLVTKGREMPFSGRWSQAYDQRVGAALAALEGRSEDARTLYATALQLYDDLSLHFEWATTAVESMIALPEDSAAAAWTAQARPMLESLGARPMLDILTPSSAMADPSQALANETDTPATQQPDFIQPDASAIG